MLSEVNEDNHAVTNAERLNFPIRYSLLVFAIGYGFAFFLITFYSLSALKLPWYVDIILLLLVSIVAITVSAYNAYRYRDPARKGSELYFTDTDCFRRIDLILRYDLLKNAILILIPLVIIFMLVYHVALAQLTNSTFVSNFLYALKLGFAVPTILIFGMMNPIYTFRKEFRYYLAKECFLVSKDCFQLNKKETDENKTVETTKYILLGLQSYNAYIKRNIGLQINNINRIYSIITSNKDSPGRYVTEVNNNIDDNDKLKLVRYLRDISGNGNKNDDEDNEEFLVKEKLRDKILSLSAWIVPVITILISIVQLFLGPSSR